MNGSTCTSAFSGQATRGYLVLLNSISDDLLNINCIQSCFPVVKITVRLLP